MIYRAIGIMSGSSLDGLDIAFVEFDERGGKWSYEIKQAYCFEYDTEWTDRLKKATGLNAYDYNLLDVDFGRYIGQRVNSFIEMFGLEHQVQLISSHGHTTFHAPHLAMTAQIGCGAAIAAATGINVVSDFRALDVAFGGQGAPIVPIGEQLLLSEYTYLLNIGGIANLSIIEDEQPIAFDVCPANRVLNAIASLEGVAFDADGALAAQGKLNQQLLTELNNFEYYRKDPPKSLDNGFGLNEIIPLIESYNIDNSDALRTYVEHIALQVQWACMRFHHRFAQGKLLVTGGGALNGFLLQRIQDVLHGAGIEVVVPDPILINFKEAMVMALMGVLRWREEYNVLQSVTGARRSSIGGAVWIGQEA